MPVCRGGVADSPRFRIRRDMSTQLKLANELEDEVISTVARGFRITNGAARAPATEAAREPEGLMARPIVGITTYVTGAVGVWEQDSVLVPHSTSLRSSAPEAGRYSCRRATEGVEETLDALDGLILSGGADLDPALRRGAHPRPKAVSLNATPGSWPAARGARARPAGARDLPRGQVLNVVLGGDLVQHLPDVVGDERHGRSPGPSRSTRSGRSGSKLAGPGRRRRSSRTTTRGSGTPARSGVTARAEDGTVEGLEGLRIVLRWACSGTRRQARISACSRRSSPKPRGTAPRRAEPQRRSEPPSASTASSIVWKMRSSPSSRSRRAGPSGAPSRRTGPHLGEREVDARRAEVRTSCVRTSAA